MTTKTKPPRTPTKKLMVPLTKRPLTEHQKKILKKILPELPSNTYQLCKSAGHDLLQMYAFKKLLQRIAARGAIYYDWRDQLWKERNS